MTNENTWWSDSLDYSTRSDIGMRRTNNQDAARSVPAASLRLWHKRGHLFIVADGMGAHAAGELASQMAADAIPQSYLKGSLESPADALRGAILQAHEKIKRQGKSDDAFRDMGTTVDVLVLLPEGALVGHVGDSRVYRLRHGAFEQLTFDHSLVWEVKRSGRIPEDKIPAYIPKNVITRSLGPTENLVVDLEGPYALEVGDTFLLCSDGLSGQVDDSEMGQILAVFSPEEATETLVNLANLRGGPDNVTVSVARMTAIPDAEPENAVLFPEKRPNISTLALSFLAMAIASILPVFFLFLVQKNDHQAQLSLAFFLLFSIFFGTFVFLARKTLFTSGRKSLDEQQLGAGPYVRSSAKPTLAFATRLADLRQQLAEAVKQQRVAADWEKIRAWEKELPSLTRAGKVAEVIRANARIINALMREIKNQSNKSKNEA
ncbi:MAG: protein phosphatase 2C domain-containing protein [Planctomycetia bacterium]|nr:protein phosphatase 2C domain-containing protein [Planctomycetia bacterium]